jgi:hypothetical protein
MMMKKNICDHERKQYFVHTGRPISPQLFFSHTNISNLEDQSNNIVRNEIRRVFLRGSVCNWDPLDQTHQSPLWKMSTRLCILLLWKPINYRSLEEITSVITTTAISRCVPQANLWIPTSTNQGSAISSRDYIRC